MRVFAIGIEFPNDMAGWLGDSLRNCRGGLDDVGNGIRPGLDHAVLPDKEFVGIDGQPIEQGL